MAWNDGYVSQIEYSRSYCQHINPLAIKLALLAHGHHALNNRPLRYLELGFGQGLSLNIHAVANDGEFWGNDFMPSHATTAKTMAEASGANVTILDDSFAQLAARRDLPTFDIIALHGVWTWISAENRGHILKIIKSNLALGGVVYINYNISPGYTSMIPVRDLMMLHVHTISPASAPLFTKMKSAMSFMQQLMDAGAAYFGKTPEAVGHFNRAMKEINPEHSPEHLAHEFFHLDWAIMSFADVAAQLTNAKLSYAGDAIINNKHSKKLLAPKIKSLLDNITDPLFYQSVRDFCVNEQYRADLWLKGVRTVTALQRLQLLAEMRFMLLSPSPAESLIFSTNSEKISLDENSVRLIIEALADNHFEPKSINALLNYPSLKHFNLSQACDMTLSLCGICVAPAHDEETIALLKPKTDKLNSYLLTQSQQNERNLFLASPVTGGGVHVPRMHQLSLLAIKNGFSGVDQVATFIWEVLSSQEQFAITAEGVPCNGKSENIKELTLRAESFFERHLPILTALKIS